MIDSMADLDTHKNEIFIKWQLFREAGQNRPLGLQMFDYAYNYARERGYQTTASVFDLESLKFLMTYDIPFVKIANNERSADLTKYIPRGIDIITSWVYHLLVSDDYNSKSLACIASDGNGT